MITPLEAALWVVLVTCVFNFTPALFTDKSLNEAPVWSKAIKDGPVLLLLAALAYHHWRAGRWREELRANRRFVVVLAVLAFYVAASAATVAQSLSSVVSARYYVLYPLIAVAIGTAQLGGEVWLRLAFGLVGFAVFESFVGIAHVIGLFGPTFYAGSVEIGNHVFERAIATFGNPNNLGMFLGLGALVAVWGPLPENRLRTAAIAVIVVGVALTFSKNAILGLALTLALSCEPWRGWRRALTAVAVIAVGISMTAVAVMARGGTESTLGTRSATVPAALDASSSSPRVLFLGHGFGAQSTIVDSDEIRDTVIDNMVLELMYEAGLIGVGLFGGLILASVSLAIRTWRTPKAALGRPLALYVLFFCLYTPFAVNFRLYPGALLYWIGAGVMASLLASGRGRITPRAASNWQASARARQPAPPGDECRGRRLSQ